jgi:hypothetical protein
MSLVLGQAIESLLARQTPDFWIDADVVRYGTYSTQLVLTITTSAVNQ